MQEVRQSTTTAASLSGHSHMQLSPHQTWQPGEYLPEFTPPTDLHSLLSEMQGAITAEIQKVQASVETLTGRVNQLEKDMSGTTEQLKLCQTPTSSSLSSTDSSEKSVRKKRIPIALSVSIICMTSVFTYYCTYIFVP